MNSLEFHQLFFNWSLQRDTAHPQSAAAALIYLHTLLVDQVQIIADAPPGSPQWQSAAQNGFALLTLSPLSGFQRDLIQHDNLYISVLAAIASPRTILGYVPAGEDSALADHLSGVEEQELIHRMQILNQTKYGSEAEECWKETGLPGYAPALYSVEAYDLLCQSVA